MNKKANNCSKFLGALLMLSSLDIASSHEIQADESVNERSNKYKKEKLINTTINCRSSHSYYKNCNKTNEEKQNSLYNKKKYTKKSKHKDIKKQSHISDYKSNAQNLNRIKKMLGKSINNTDKNIGTIAGNTKTIERNRTNINKNTQGIDANAAAIENLENININDLNNPATKKNTQDIETNKQSINDNSAAINSNAADISSNNTAIKGNQDLIMKINAEIPDGTAILDNAEKIKINREGIASNSNILNRNNDSIFENIDKIASNEASIGNNFKKIDINENQVANNVQSIATNKDNIGNNTEKILTNTDQINTNTGNITVNSESISTNQSALSSLGTIIDIENINSRVINANGIEIEGENLISRDGNGVISIGKNSIKSVERNGKQLVWATDTNGDSIPINITNGSDFQINGVSVQGQIDNNNENISTNTNAILNNQKVINNVQDNVNELGYGVAGATALSTAISALPTVSQDSPISCGLGTGGYSSRFAMSVGCAVKASERVSINAGVSHVFGGAADYGNGSLSTAAARAGFILKLGKINTPTTNNEEIRAQLNKIQNLNNKIQQENVAIKKHNEELLRRLERLEAISYVQSTSTNIGMR